MTKQPIVILHGWGSSPDRWQAIHDLLGEVFIPMLPGFDGKELPKAFGVDDYVGWLAGYLDGKKIKNPVLVGHSNGGRIAIRYAATHKNVPKLILIGAAGIPNTHLSTKRTIFKFLATAGKKVLSPIKNTAIYASAEKLLYKLARESDYLKASPMMKQTMQKLLEYDATPDLKKITCRTLCIWGSEDQATPLWMGQKIAAEIPDCTMKIIEGGHSIHRTHAGEVASLILNFI